MKAIPMDEPESMIASLAPEEKVVIVTHDHALDLRLLHQLLDETALASIGLIGSETKASRSSRSYERWVFLRLRTGGGVARRFALGEREITDGGGGEHRLAAAL